MSPSSSTNIHSMMLDVKETEECENNVIQIGLENYPKNVNQSVITHESLEDTKSRKKRNKMSFTMKKVPECISIDSNEDSSGSAKKLSSFTCRADVIYKKILRDFRRYFVNNFNEVTQYKFHRKTKPKDFLLKCLREYCSVTFSECIPDFEEVVLALGTLVAPNELNKSLSSNHKMPKKEVNRIHDTLYKFSITKVDNLLEDRHVMFLLKHFILTSNCREELIGLSEISAKSYATAFDLILSRAEERRGV